MTDANSFQSLQTQASEAEQEKAKTIISVGPSSNDSATSQQTAPPTQSSATAAQLEEQGPPSEPALKPYHEWVMMPTNSHGAGEWRQVPSEMVSNDWW